MVMFDLVPSFTLTQQAVLLISQLHCFWTLICAQQEDEKKKEDLEHKLKAKCCLDAEKMQQKISRL